MTITDLVPTNLGKMGCMTKPGGLKGKSNPLDQHSISAASPVQSGIVKGWQECASLIEMGE